MKARYTVHRYSPNHFAIDCEECIPSRKIVDIFPTRETWEIMERVNAHERTHGDRA